MFGIQKKAKPNGEKTLSFHFSIKELGFEELWRHWDRDEVAGKWGEKERETSLLGFDLNGSYTSFLWKLWEETVTVVFLRRLFNRYNFFRQSLFFSACWLTINFGAIYFRVELFLIWDIWCWILFMTSISIIIYTKNLKIIMIFFISIQYFCFS